MAEVVKTKMNTEEKGFIKIPNSVFDYATKEDNLTPQELVLFATLSAEATLLSSVNEGFLKLKTNARLLSADITFYKKSLENRKAIVEALEGLVNKKYISLEVFGKDLSNADLLKVTLLTENKIKNARTQGMKFDSFTKVTVKELKEYTEVSEKPAENSYIFKIFVYTKWRDGFKSEEEGKKWTTSYSVWAEMLFVYKKTAIKYLNNNCISFLGVIKNGKTIDNNGKVMDEPNSYYLLEAEEQKEIEKEVLEHENIKVVFAIKDYVKELKDFERITDKRVDEAMFKRLTVIGKNQKEYGFKYSEYHVYKTSEDQFLKELVEKKINNLTKKNSNLAEMFERFEKEFLEAQKREQQQREALNKAMSNESPYYLDDEDLDSAYVPPAKRKKESGQSLMDFLDE